MIQGFRQPGLNKVKWKKGDSLAETPLALTRWPGEGIMTVHRRFAAICGRFELESGAGFREINYISEPRI